MCPRLRQFFSADVVATHATVRAGVPAGAAWAHRSSYTQQQTSAPGADLAIVAADGAGGVSLRTMRWGLKLSSSKGVAAKPDYWRHYCARSESVHTTWSRLVSGGKRCAVPISGWYEWQADEFKEVKSKQPFYVGGGADGAPLWAAAVYDDAVPPPPLPTFTLLTRDASSSLAWLHERQPVLLDEAGLREWLHGGGGGAHLSAVRQSAADADALTAPLRSWPVSKAVSKVGFQGEAAASPIKLVSEKQMSIASLFGKKPKAEAAAAASSSVVAAAAVPAGASSAASPVRPGAKVDIASFPKRPAPSPPAAASKKPRSG